MVCDIIYIMLTYEPQNNNPFLWRHCEGGEEYTGQRILAIAKGNSVLSNGLFQLADWQRIETIFYELVKDGEIDETGRILKPETCPRKKAIVINKKYKSALDLSLLPYTETEMGLITYDNLDANDLIVIGKMMGRYETMNRVMRRPLRQIIAHIIWPSYEL